MWVKSLKVVVTLRQLFSSLTLKISILVLILLSLPSSVCMGAAIAVASFINFINIFEVAGMSWLSATSFLGNSRMEFSRHPGFARSQGMSLSVDLAQV